MLTVQLDFVTLLKLKINNCVPFTTSVILRGKSRHTSVDLSTTDKRQSGSAVIFAEKEPWQLPIQRLLIVYVL